MPLTSGSRIGPYEIVAVLGAGGMGEVYRARDSKLKREVALKVLPAELADDRERLARFQREAEVLASLNHPNIAHIHGLEEANGTIALVMELVEGEDLSQRLARGPMPIDDALPIATQIAEALEAAHEQGIVHRDLKPANVKVRPDGTVKVLDFGLAKALEPAAGTGAERDLANSPTITSPAMTMRGVILGTAAYMAPEQAKGKPVDKRADTWAFGCVLYEMLTGTRTFEGEDVTDTIVAVISKEPDWSRLPPGSMPPSILRLLRRCLVKERKNRLPDIGVARLEIEEAMTYTADLVHAVSPRRSPLWVAALIAATVVALAAGWASSRYLSRPVEPALPLRFQVAAADGAVFTQRVTSFLSLSPDGRQLAYLAETGNADASEIWIQSFADGSVRKLQNTMRTSGMFWSPDGRAIAFFSNNRLQRIDLATGSVTTIADARSSHGAWNRNGIILYGWQTIMQVPAAGGTPTPASTLDAETGELLHGAPHFLPDGRRFLFGVYKRDSTFALRVGELGSLTSRVIGTDMASGAQYIEPGYLVYARDARLFARGFDSATGTWTGDRMIVSEAVRQGSSGIAAFSTAVNGTIAYDATSVFGLDVDLAWVTRDGKPAPPLATMNGVHTIALGATDAMLAVEHSAGALNAVWLLDVTRGTRSRFTFGTATQGHPIWSPDGARVAFFDGRAGAHTRLFIKPAAGTGEATPVSIALNEPVASRQPTDWSTDGRFLIYEEQQTGTQWDLKYVDLGGDGQPQYAVRTPASERLGQLSPDGRFIAYESNESGRTEIYVSTFPKAEMRWTISNRGGAKARWARGGRELLFVDGDGVLQSVPVEVRGGALWAGLPSPLFPLGAVDSDGFNYDISSDGSKFIVMRSSAQGRAHRVSVIMNWPATVAR